MFSLILKDFLLTRKTLLVSIAYAVFILIAFQSETLALASYIMGAVAITYLYLLSVCAYDDKNNTELVLNSLPLSRESIVKARYLSVFIYLALALVIIGGLGFLFKAVGLPIPRNYLSPLDVLGAFVSIGLLCTIYLPCFFRWGYIKSRLFNLVLFLLFFFIPSLLVDYVQRKYSQESMGQLIAFLNGLPSWSISAVLAAVILFLLYISYRVSRIIYSRREF